MSTDESFHDWWFTYPRRVGKKTAKAKWLIAVKEIAAEKKISSDTAVKWLQQQTVVFAASDKGKSGQFCPYPATWLGQGRYDDDPEEWGVRKAMRTIREISEDWRP